MKKFFVILMAAMLLMTAVSSAMAASETVLFGTAQNVAWIDGTNLLRVEGNTGYGISDMNGNMLTGTLYASSFTRDDTIITAAQLDVDELNYMGAFDLNGKQIIPFQYGVIDVFNSSWAAGITLENATAELRDYSNYSGDSFLITGVDIYNLKSRTCVASLTRSQYAEAYAIRDTINIADRATGVITAYDSQFNVLGTDLKYTTSDDYAQPEFIIFRENGQRGIQDAEGNVIMEPSFQYIYDFRYGYAVVSTGEQEGLVDKQGNVVVEPIFDNVKTMSNLTVDAEGDAYGYKAQGYFCIQKDDKIGYVDEAGNITCEPKYSKDIVQINGASLTYTDMEGKQHIMAADGVDTVVDGYERMYALAYLSGVYYRVSDSAGKLGMIDWHGNVVFPCEYTSISASGDGKYVMVTKDYTNSEIYLINYPDASTVAEETAAEPAPEAVEVAVESHDQEVPAVDTASVKALLDSAKLLLNTDAAANKDAVISLITNANNMLAGSNVSVATLLDSAVTMLNTDAATNGAAVVAIIDSAVTLF